MPITFWQDLKHRGLLPVKILLFIQAAGDMALYPFLTLHMKYLGITVTEIGIQFALTPVATLLATPLVGLLADKIGNFKMMLSISLLLVAGLSQLFILVPPVVEHRNREVALLGCSPAGNLMAERLPSEMDSGSNVTLEECSWTCPESSRVCLSELECLDLNRTVTFAVGRPDEDRWTLTEPGTHGRTYLCPQEGNSCEGRCKVGLGGPPKIDPSRRKITFWSYLALRIVLYVIIATEMSLLKAACLTTVDKHNSEYGFQRIWPNIASCITPVVTGVMMDRLQNGEVEDYNPCFYIFGGMKLLMGLITLFVELSPKPPTLDIWKNVVALIRNPEVFFMLAVTTFVGSCWGYLETFLFLYLEGLGASKMLMGMTFTIGSAAGIIPSIFAGAIERKIGHVAIICIGLVAYAVRFVGYTFIPSAPYALIFEALECLTMSLMLITITTYANHLASAELVATMQATWAALHFAVGRALGSLVGGFMIAGVGSVATYRIYAGKCLLVAVSYYLVYNCWLKKRAPPQEPGEPAKEKVEKVIITGDSFVSLGFDTVKENGMKISLSEKTETKPKPESEMDGKTMKEHKCETKVDSGQVNRSFQSDEKDDRQTRT